MRISATIWKPRKNSLCCLLLLLLLLLSGKVNAKRASSCNRYLLFCFFYLPAKEELQCGRLEERLLFNTDTSTEPTEYSWMGILFQQNGKFPILELGRRLLIILSLIRKHICEYALQRGHRGCSPRADHGDMCATLQQSTRAGRSASGHLERIASAGRGVCLQ